MVVIASVFLTQRFSSSQMFSIMLKSGDLRGESTTFILFPFRYAVVALIKWAEAPSCSNCIPLWFLDNGMTSVSSIFRVDSELQLSSPL